LNLALARNGRSVGWITAGSRDDRTTTVAPRRRNFEPRAYVAPQAREKGFLK